MYKLKKIEGHKDRKVTSDGQECITDYVVEKEYPHYSLIRVTIITGRTHQIRAGMASIGHPLVGDRLYGGDLAKIKRVALHCARLTFTQPFTNEKIEINCEMDESLMSLLNS